MEENAKTDVDAKKRKVAVPAKGEKLSPQQYRAASENAIRTVYKVVHRHGSAEDFPSLANPPVHGPKCFSQKVFRHGTLLRTTLGGTKWSTWSRRARSGSRTTGTVAKTFSTTRPRRSPTSRGPKRVAARGAHLPGTGDRTAPGNDASFSWDELSAIRSESSILQEGEKAQPSVFAGRKQLKKEFQRVDCFFLALDEKDGNIELHIKFEDGPQASEVSPAPRPR